MSSTVVAPGGLEISSNSESAAEMVTTLATPAKEGQEAKAPRALLDGGKLVEKTEDAEKVSAAAAELGKKGGAAAAKARKAAEKEAAKSGAGKDGAAADAEGEQKAAAGAGAKEGDPDPDAQPPAEPELTGRARERVEKVTREAAQLKRDLAAERQNRAALEQRLAALERGHGGPQAGVDARREAPHAAAGADDDPEPSEADFETRQEYDDARTRWVARDEHRRVEGARSAERQAHEFTRGVLSVHQRVRDAFVEAEKTDPAIREKTQDFLATLVPTWHLQQGEQPSQANLITDEILLSRVSPWLALHFTEHPEDFQRIATLRTERDIWRAVAKIEARVEDAIAGTSSSSGQPAPKPAVSKAPPPVRPVTGAPHTAEPDLSGDIPFDRYVHLRGRSQGSRAAR